MNDTQNSPQGTNTQAFSKLQKSIYIDRNQKLTQEKGELAARLHEEISKNINLESELCHIKCDMTELQSSIQLQMGELQISHTVEVKKLQKLQKEHLDQIAQLQQQIKCEKETSGSLTQKLQTEQSLLPPLQTQISDLTAQNQQLNRQLSEAQQLTSDLKKQLAAAQQPPPPQDAEQSLTIQLKDQQISELTSTLKQVQEIVPSFCELVPTQVQSQDSIVKQLYSLLNSLRQSTSTNQILTRPGQESRGQADKLDELSEILDERASQLDKLTQQLHSCEVAMQEMRDEKEVLDSTIVSKEQEVLDVQAENEFLKSEKALLQKKFDRLNQDQKRIEECQKEVLKRRDQQIEELRRQLEGE